MPQLTDRNARSYLVWNDDGTIREYDTVSCAHCRKIMVRNPTRVRGLEQQDNELDYDYRCFKCSNRHICKQCAQQMHANGDVCVAFEQRIERMEKLCQDYGRFPSLDRTQALILAVHR